MPEPTPPLDLGATHLFQSVLEASEKPKEPDFFSPREEAPEKPEPSTAPVPVPEPVKTPSPSSSGPGSLQNSNSDLPKPQPAEVKSTPAETPKEPEPQPKSEPQTQSTQPEKQPEFRAPKPVQSESPEGSGSTPIPVANTENKGKDPVVISERVSIIHFIYPNSIQQSAPVLPKLQHQLMKINRQPQPHLNLHIHHHSSQMLPKEHNKEEELHLQPHNNKEVKPTWDFFSLTLVLGQVSTTEINLMLLLLAFIAGYVSSWLF